MRVSNKLRMSRRKSEIEDDVVMWTTLRVETRRGKSSVDNRTSPSGSMLMSCHHNIPAHYTFKPSTKPKAHLCAAFRRRNYSLDWSTYFEYQLVGTLHLYEFMIRR